MSRPDSRFSGNEPNLKQPLVGGFWTGSQAEYFQLFAATARALKRVSPRLQVGGPTTSGAPAWVADFLAFGERAQVPIDFVSSHFYPAAGERDGLAAALAAITNLTDVGGGGDAALPVVLSEFNSGLHTGCCHDDPFAAAYLVYTLGQVQRYATRGVASLMYWCFSDVFEEQQPVATNADRPPFHNAFGLQTMDGIKKPAFRALELLAAFPNETLPATRAVSGGDRPRHPANHIDAYAGVIPPRFDPPRGSPGSSGTNVSVMLSSWSPTLLPVADQQVGLEVLFPSIVSISGPAATCTATITWVPDPKAVWRSMGAPTTLNATQLRLLELAAVLAPSPIGCTVVTMVDDPAGTGSGTIARVLVRMPVQAAVKVSIVL